MKYKHLAAAGNFTINGPTRVLAVNVNTGAAGASLTLYDGTDATGVVIAVYDATTKSSHAALAYAHNGLHVVLAGGNADIQISYE